MSDKMPEIIAVDCETDPFKNGRIPEPFLWGAYNGEQYWQFETTAELVLFLSSRKAIAYAHNGGKFDWHFVIPYIKTLQPLTVINGRITKAKLGECEIRDSYSLIPVPLKSLDSEAGKKLDIEYWKLEKEHRQEHWQEIERYLERDCVVLWENVSRFIADYGLHLTQAGAAMKIWEAMSGETERTDAVYFERFSPYYYGGRTQCFVKGLIEHPFRVYDIKSAYPHAMRVAKHPKGRPFRGEWDGKDGAALVSVIARSRGVFPHRGEDGLEFPDDNETRLFHVTGWELMLYEEKFGPVISVEECHRFAFRFDFSPYVDRFYALKAEAERTGDKAARHFAKIFLNALYGKYAANPENYSDYQIVDVIAGETAPPGYAPAEILDHGRLFATKPIDEEQMRYFNVATAASITGFVRAKLARVILESEIPLYCDTDSIACVKFGGDIIGKELGQWELEANCVRGAIGGKKLYAFETSSGNFKTASKGAKLSEKEIFSVASGFEASYKPDAPSFSVKKKPVFTNRTIRRT